MNKIDDVSQLSPISVVMKDSRAALRAALGGAYGAAVRPYRQFIRQLHEKSGYPLTSCGGFAVLVCSDGSADSERELLVNAALFDELDAAPPALKTEP